MCFDWKSSLNSTTLKNLPFKKSQILIENCLVASSSSRFYDQRWSVFNCIVSVYWTIGQIIGWIAWPAVFFPFNSCQTADFSPVWTINLSRPAMMRWKINISCLTVGQRELSVMLTSMKRMCVCASCRSRAQSVDHWAYLFILIEWSRVSAYDHQSLVFFFVYWHWQWAGADIMLE